MVAYHSSNVILVEPFKSRKDTHRLAAYDVIMQRLKDKGLTVDLQVLDNECSKEYERRMTEKWGVEFQLVPPDMHRRNAAERAIRSFKAHFLAILAGVATDFPRNLWDLLLPQSEMTLNMLRQATADPTTSAWDFFAKKKFNYSATPLGPLGINVIVHAKPGRRKSWDFRGKDGWSVGVSLKHYRCQLVIPKLSKSLVTSDTTEFRHHHITQPSVTPDDRVTHGLQQLVSALQGGTPSRSSEQLDAIQQLQDTLTGWSADVSPTGRVNRLAEAQEKWNDRLRQLPAHNLPEPTAPAPRVATHPRPRVPTQSPVLPEEAQPVAHRTRSTTARVPPPYPPPRHILQRDLQAPGTDSPRAP